MKNFAAYRIFNSAMTSIRSYPLLDGGVNRHDNGAEMDSIWG